MEKLLEMWFRIYPILVTGSVFASSPGDAAREAFDWNPTKEIFPGIRHVQRSVSHPRAISFNILRVDLENPSIHVHATPRAGNYKEESSETMRETTTRFLARARGNGESLVVAVNASPWTPWPPPVMDNGAANITGFAVSEGMPVSPDTGAPFLALTEDRRVKVVSKLAAEDSAGVVSAFPGFSVVLSDNILLGSDDGKVGLAPRTGFGTSHHGRFLYLMTVDGRQEGFSLGCTVREVGEWLRFFGAEDGLNMDGGGSTSMVWWNGEKNEVQGLNRPSDRILGAVVERPVAFHLGISFSENSESGEPPSAVMRSSLWFECFPCRAVLTP